MVSGKVPFQGSFSELSYQHQHDLATVDKLKLIPRPVIVLLEIVLEKDPSRRFQTPTELLKAIAKVTKALDSGRRITTDQLRSEVDGTGGPGETEKGVSAHFDRYEQAYFPMAARISLGRGRMLLALYLFSGSWGTSI